MKILCVTTLVATALVVLGACSSNDDHHHDSSYPSCDAIIEACHPVDKGEGGKISECHTLAHEATGDATCAPKKDECVHVCEAAATDAGGQ